MDIILITFTNHTKCVISCAGVFDKFKSQDNKFQETLSSDIEGLLSLHEAAYVQMHGEETLEEIVVFTAHHLTRFTSQLKSPLKDKVKRVLE